MDAKAIAKYLTALYRESGQTYDDVEKGSGVPRSTISRLMHGTTANPQASTVAALVKHFGGSMDDLAQIENTPDTDEAISQPDGIPLDVYREIAQSATDSLSASFQRHTDAIEASHAKHLADVEAAHAAHMATMRKVARQRLRWIIILSVILAAVVFWFLWDLSHPEIGFIRLKQAGYLSLGFLGRR